MSDMRAKMQVSAVIPNGPDHETLYLHAVHRVEGYDETGSDENNTYAKYTPSASLSMDIANPTLVGKFKVGEHYYLDFTKV